MRLICFDDRGSPRHAVLLDDGVLPLDALPEARGIGLREILGHGAAGLAYAETQDWDRINSVVLKTYRRVIERRERYARLTGRRTI